MERAIFLCHSLFGSPVLRNIIPPELRRKKALCNLLIKTNQLENSIVFDVIQNKPIQKLKSRECTWKIFDDVKQFNINEHWTRLCNEASVYGNEILNDPTRKVSGTELERSTWVLLNN